AVFYYDIEDMIVRPDRDGLFINLDSAKIHGLECWVSYGGDSGFNYSFSYSYTDAEETNSIYGKRTLEYVPENMIQGEAGYSFTFGTSINLATTWRDEVNDYDKDDTRIIPDYTLLDVYIRHDFDFGLGLSLKVSNITDKNYYQEIGFPRPGRNIVFGVSYVL
ncbi:TonB-dependent receptor, partial [bacterium]|nr:TonB-dependent receptor [bacterium]